MEASHHGSHRRIPASNRIAQGVRPIRPIIEVAVLLVSAVALGVVLVGALVWTLWTLGLVLS